jgi:hypothetical protein
MTASATPKVDMKNAERVVGRENDIRVDAQLLVSEVGASANVPIAFQIENMRSTPIAFAERATQTSYDPQTQTITITLGAEIPGSRTAPSLTVIEPGQTRTFTTGAPLRIAASSDPRARNVPRYMRIKLSFLGEVAPFRKLVNAQAPKVNPDELFVDWIEHVEAVFTNSLPIRWGMNPVGGNGADASAARSRF